MKEPQLPFFRMMYLDLTLRRVIVDAMPEQAKQHAIAEIARAHELVEHGGRCVVVSVTS